MPAHSTVIAGTVLAGAALTLQAGLAVNRRYKEYQEEVERREQEAEEQRQAQLLEEWHERRRADEEQAKHKRKAAKKNEGQDAFHALLDRAQELYQVRMLDALDSLEQQLRSCGVGAGAPLPLPGAEDPDRVAAATSLLFGRQLWEVLGPARKQSLLGFGGTLSLFSPTAAAVVAGWLRGLGDKGSGLPRGAGSISDTTLDRLLGVLVSALKLPVDSEGLCSWACLFLYQYGELQALTALVREALPGVTLLPHASMTSNAGGTSTTLRGRSDAAGGPYADGSFMPPEPGQRVAMLAFCMPDPTAINGVKHHEKRYCTPIQRPFGPESNKRVPRDVLERSLGHLWAGVCVLRAVRSARRRVEGLGPGGLAGCGWEQLAALSGSASCVGPLLSQHDAWWAVSEQLQGDEQQQRVRVALREGLLRALPPPQEAAAGAAAAAGTARSKREEQGDDDGSAQRRQQQRALEQEVDAFIGDLMPLTHARYMCVPEAPRLPEELVPPRPLEADMLAGFVEHLPMQNTVRVAFRDAHRLRREALQAATHPPRWLPAALAVCIAVALALVLFGLEQGALATAQALAPQQVALILDGLESLGGQLGRVASVAAPLPAWAPAVLASGWRLLLRWTFLWLWLPAAAAAQRGVAAALPDVWGAGVEAVQTRLRLGSFMGRYDLPALQQRVSRQQAAWALRLAQARMRDAVGRGRVAWPEVLAILGGLHAAAEAAEAEAPGGGGDGSSNDVKRGGAGGGSGAGSEGVSMVEVVLPGTREEVQAFLDLPVDEPEAEQQQQTGRSASGAAAGITGLAAGGTDAFEARALCRCLMTPRQEHTPRLLGAGDTPTGDAGEGGKGRGKKGQRSGGGGVDGGGGADAGTPSTSFAVAPAGGKAGAARRQGGRGAKAVSKMLESEGWQVVRRGKHTVYRRVVGSGSKQTFVRSATPSDWRTAANQLAALRRLNMEAELDLVVAARIAVPAAARHASAQAAAAAAADAAAAGADALVAAAPGVAGAARPCVPPGAAAAAAAAAPPALLLGLQPGALPEELLQALRGVAGAGGGPGGGGAT